MSYCCAKVDSHSTPMIRGKQTCSIERAVGLGVIVLSGAISAIWFAHGSIVGGFAILGGGCTLGCALIIISRNNYLPQRLPYRFIYDEPESAYRGRILKTEGKERTALVHYSFIESRPEYKAAKTEILKKIAENSLTTRERWALGIMMGMAVGDAVGAPFEFLAYKPSGYLREGQHFDLTKEGMVGAVKVYNKFRLEPGQWTDDTSMGLCLADVLIASSDDAYQMMWAFYDWWHYGYNNAFTKGEAKGSVGLGGNISDALKKFEEESGWQKTPTGETQWRNTGGRYATTAGDQNTSGNGGLMRLGPAAIAAKSVEQAEEFARKQSLVTHQGKEAEVCAAMMARCLFNASNMSKEEAIDNLSAIDWGIESVNDLANCRGEWNWRDPDFTFNEARFEFQSSTYLGSYAMDALAMALHCVWTTDSFEEAVIKASTRGGDADSVGAVTGQIAGAIYGFGAIPKTWVEAVQQWDRGGEIVARASLLCDLP